MRIQCKQITAAKLSITFEKKKKKKAFYSPDVQQMNGKKLFGNVSDTVLQQKHKQSFTSTQKR